MAEETLHIVASYTSPSLPSSDVPTSRHIPLVVHLYFDNAHPIPADLRVQVWTNAPEPVKFRAHHQQSVSNGSTDQWIVVPRWHAIDIPECPIPFLTTQKTKDPNVTLKTYKSHLDLGTNTHHDVELTFRLTYTNPTTNGQTLHWLGTPSQNAILSPPIPPSHAPNPPTLSTYFTNLHPSIKETPTSLTPLSLSTYLTFTSHTSHPFLNPHKQTHHLLIDRSGPWWYEPRAGRQTFDTEKNSDSVLWIFKSAHDPDNVVVVITLLHAYMRTVKEDGVEVKFTGFDEREKADCWVGVGSDVYEVLKVGAGVLREVMGFKEKEVGGAEDSGEEEEEGKWFYDWFGWCSWNSFYASVSEENIIQALKEYRAANIPTPIVLIDDGWQNVNSGMVDFEWNTKFLSGPALMKHLKKEFDVKEVGVWHHMLGYWDGIQRNGPIAQKYKTTIMKTTGGDEMHLVHEDDVVRFYQDWHDKLRADGVGWFKVDGQATFDYITNSETTWRSYQKAIMAADPDNSTIWCMAISPRIILWSLLGHYGGKGAFKKGEARKVWRNSDDFFPDIAPTNPWHVYQNAMTAMVLGTWGESVVLDWDMFQSSHPYAQFHAHARCISGGPVMISDLLGKHSRSVVLPCYYSSSGRVIRFPFNAKPSNDTLFTRIAKGSSTGHEGVVKITNRGDKGRGEGVGVVGAFGCQGGETVVTGRVGVEVVVGLSKVAEEYVVRVGVEGPGRIGVVRWGDGGVPVKLGRGEAEWLVFVPVEEHEAVLVKGSTIRVGTFGVVDKYTGPITIKSRFFLSSSSSSSSGSVTHQAFYSVRGVVGYFIDAPRVPEVRIVDGEDAAGLRVESLNGEGVKEKGPWWVEVDLRKDGEEALESVGVEMVWRE
ncbi:hypothetical protein HDV00_006501 [Rhizophlyctis rosea]|nr:hypothetical protein HDV00_006501 [Rhizophlyctis rosea]